MKKSSSEDLFFESLEQSLQHREQQDTAFQRINKNQEMLNPRFEYIFIN